MQMSSDSQVKKLEEQLSEANRRGDELQRTLSELSVAKNRLSGMLSLEVRASMSSFSKKTFSSNNLMIL